MKKVLLVAIVAVFASMMAFAQGPISGNTAYTPTNDILGAHEMAAAVARVATLLTAAHAVAAVAPSSAPAATAPAPRSTATQHSGAPTRSYMAGRDPHLLQTAIRSPCPPVGASGSAAIFTGVVTCLSCHDGNVFKRRHDVRSRLRAGVGSFELRYHTSVPTIRRLRSTCTASTRFRRCSATMAAAPAITTTTIQSDLPRTSAQSSAAL